MNKSIITKEQELRAFITGFLTAPAHDEHSENSMTAQVFRIALAAMDAEPVADVVAWYKEGEERTCDIRLRRFDVAPGPLFAVAQPVTVDNTFIPKNLDRALGVVGVALPESKEEFNFQI